MNSHSAEFGTNIMSLLMKSQGPSLHHYLKAIEEYPEMKDVYPSIHKDMVEENEIILLN